MRRTLSELFPTAAWTTAALLGLVGCSNVSPDDTGADAVTQALSPTYDGLHDDNGLSYVGLNAWVTASAPER